VRLQQQRHHLLLLLRCCCYRFAGQGCLLSSSATALHYALGALLLLVLPLLLLRPWNGHWRMTAAAAGALAAVLAHSVLQDEQLLATLAGTSQPGVAAVAVLLGLQVTWEAWGLQSHWIHGKG
jgi:hypothetical protein